jgi:DNA-binding transcriptional regulator of glucitol operon
VGTYRYGVESGPSKVTLLQPKWLLLHVVTIAMCCGMIWLGNWQWRAAIRHHGEIRNYAYALQWWAFTGFTSLMWFRVVRDHLRQGTPDERRPPVEAEPRYLGYQPPAAQVDDADPERARFNAYLARLHDSEREASP